MQDECCPRIISSVSAEQMDKLEHYHLENMVFVAWMQCILRIENKILIFMSA